MYATAPASVGPGANSDVGGNNAGGNMVDYDGGEFYNNPAYATAADASSDATFLARQG